MSIRLRLTLLYSAILALTLIVFGSVLYTTQAQSTLNELKQDLRASGDNLMRAIVRTYLDPNPQLPRYSPPSPIPFEVISGEQAFRDLREREIVRVLNANGALIASPFGSDQEALPLNTTGLQMLQRGQVWWEIVSLEDERLLVYNIPLMVDNQVVLIAQVARPLTERDRSLAALSTTLIIGSLLTTLAAFGIGWMLSGTALNPIHRITHTAQAIGSESDFTRRVDYTGPNDEVGRLATTFNAMLSRLQEAYQRVSDALKMQRDFVADVSHELRTPLTTVRGNLALLRRDPPIPNEEQADILNDLVEESDRLIRLVNNLLVLARADAGQSLKREPVPARTVIEQACRQARQRERQREIIEAGQEVIVQGDRDALKQVLLTLLDNALKYTEGTITVTTRTSGQHGIIEVMDNGPGISPDTLPHVFERFYRGDIDTSVSGHGLGLSIARSLIEGQGGTISIESRIAGGSTVQIRLPLAQEGQEKNR
ncbi:MAG: HAMP domain-containing histidine kinase [Anaerolineae bacterium]|nr:HAMP domain-containing histidine kinase [Anaerolineae bacterium]